MRHDRHSTRSERIKQIRIMPLPKPNANEEKSEFIGRCMAETKMISEYKDPKQRYAVCQMQWKERT